MNKLDYKKAYKDLYQPGMSPEKIFVPKMTFIMADGRGDPNQPGGEYAGSVSLLYTLAYAIKMSKGEKTDGYFEYVMPPLEGLWWYDDGGPFRFGGKAHFCWTAMIRQPEFVTPEVFEQARAAVSRKKPELDLSRARLTDFEEGLCVQCMHVGPFDEEPETVGKIETFMREQSLVSDLSDTRRHHEIYLGDPRKAKASDMKTVVRHPAIPGEKAV